jgi:hypothetical protein
MDEVEEPITAERARGLTFPNSCWKSNVSREARKFRAIVAGSAEQGAAKAASQQGRKKKSSKVDQSLKTGIEFEALLETPSS